MESLRNIARQASRRDVEFDWLLFLRNDVFELLVEDQSNRGKEDKIVVDWDSRAALCNVIERRIEASTISSALPKGVNWSDISEPFIDGQDTLNWLIERSLMRPRYLIQLVHECLGLASTSRAERIGETQLREGYRLYSLDIIGNTNFEMRDIFPNAYDAIYCLIGLNRLTDLGTIIDVISKYSYPIEDIPTIVKHLFWFGILGARTANGEEKYIYDYRYDEKIFTRIRQVSLGDDEPIYINLAFSEGLDCRNLI